MLNFGVDVLTMAFLGMLCVVLCTLTCRIMQVPSSEGKAAVLSSAIVASAMVVGYVIMACVLDNVIGIYW